MLDYELTIVVKDDVRMRFMASLTTLFKSYYHRIQESSRGPTTRTLSQAPQFEEDQLGHK